MALNARCAARNARLLHACKAMIWTTRCQRLFSTTAAEPELKATLREIIPGKRELLKEVRSKADKKIGDVRVGNVVGGMRGLKSMVWEGSVLDANEGIRFHGHTIADCGRLLPKGKTGREMLPEAMFWLLLTGQVPSEGQIRAFSRLLAEKSLVSGEVARIMSTLPPNMHPMAQMAIGISALSLHSHFAKRYAKGNLNKKNYWESIFDDSINLIARLPTIAALIYRKSCRPKSQYPQTLPPMSSLVDPEQDLSYNLASMIGYGGTGEQAEGMQDLLRLYIALHADHEGGNVSAHATHLVGSALSDPFLSYSAGLQGLAGPLHGLAAQEVLRFILKMKEHIGTSLTDEAIKDYLWSLLRSGQVIPGYGHAVLRRPDPRFNALMDFALARPAVAEDPIFQLVKKNSEIAPGVLLEHGKTKNPHPNVDSASGVLFWHYGLKEPLFYTVIFGISRALGPLAQLIWDRALGLPIERPKSVDLKKLLKLAEEGS